MTHANKLFDELGESVNYVLQAKFLKHRNDAAAGLIAEVKSKLFNGFFPLSRVFALSGLVFTAKISAKILATNDKSESESLERLLCQVLVISAGEFALAKPFDSVMHLYEFDRNNIHYNLFAKTFSDNDPAFAPPRINDIPDAANRALVELVSNNFHSDNLVRGLANYFVIERCAPVMVASMAKFLNMDANGKHRPSKYLEMHQEVEDAHSEYVLDIMKGHFDLPQHYEVFSESAVQLCKALRRFWDGIGRGLEFKGH